MCCVAVGLIPSVGTGVKVAVGGNQTVVAVSVKVGEKVGVAVGVSDNWVRNVVLQAERDRLRNTQASNRLKIQLGWGLRALCKYECMLKVVERYYSISIT